MSTQELQTHTAQVPFFHQQLHISDLDARYLAVESESNPPAMALSVGDELEDLKRRIQDLEADRLEQAVALLIVRNPASQSLSSSSPTLPSSPPRRVLSPKVLSTAHVDLVQDAYCSFEREHCSNRLLIKAMGRVVSNAVKMNETLRIWVRADLGLLDSPSMHLLLSSSDEQIRSLTESLLEITQISQETCALAFPVSLVTTGATLCDSPESLPESLGSQDRQQGSSDDYFGDIAAAVAAAAQVVPASSSSENSPRQQSSRETTQSVSPRSSSGEQTIVHSETTPSPPTPRQLRVQAIMSRLSPVQRQHQHHHPHRASASIARSSPDRENAMAESSYGRYAHHAEHSSYTHRSSPNQIHRHRGHSHQDGSVPDVERYAWMAQEQHSPRYQRQLYPPWATRHPHPRHHSSEWLQSRRHSGCSSGGSGTVALSIRTLSPMRIPLTDRLHPHARSSRF